MSKGRHRKNPQYKHRKPSQALFHAKRLGTVAAGVMLAVLALYAVPTQPAQADVRPFVSVYP